MENRYLKIETEPSLVKPSLILGFTGWMDGGDVSTGTVQYLVNRLGATRFASIEPAGFYLYNFPGTMEFSALFRPRTKIEGGLIREFDEPSNVFFCDGTNNLILFIGKEPNLAWSDYAGAIFEVCGRYGVERMVFIGSVSGLTPHTRQPRFSCVISDERIKTRLEGMPIVMTDYAGPASVITYLSVEARKRGIEMLSLVAEIPAYLQGYNPGASRRPYGASPGSWASMSRSPTCGNWATSSRRRSRRSSKPSRTCWIRFKSSKPTTMIRSSTPTWAT